MKKLQGFKDVGFILEKITKPIFDKKGYVNAQIYMNWHDIVGKDLAEKMSPNKVLFRHGQKTGGVLYVNVYQNFVTEITYMQPQIIEKIATYFGYKAVEEIKIKQKPMI